MTLSFFTFLLAWPVLFCKPTPDRLEVSLREFPADGHSGAVLAYFPGDSGVPLTGPLGDQESIHLIRREKIPGGERVYFRSTDRPGRVEFRGQASRLTLTFTPPGADADADGFPDAAELIHEEDRRAFRSWFVRISESQYLKASLAWNDRERDCSGLIRFAYREALKRHDDTWQKRSGVVLDKNLGDVARFAYPSIPVLGERLFRVRAPRVLAAGQEAYRGEPADFAPFASAEILMKWNTRLVSRDLADALPGDLLFFQDERRQSGDFHSMIVTGPGEPPVSTIVIYHTGAAAGLKRVPVTYLLELPDRRFQPLPENPFFLGIFRFLILE